MTSNTKLRNQKGYFERNNNNNNKNKYVQAKSNVNDDNEIKGNQNDGGHFDLK